MAQLLLALGPIFGSNFEADQARLRVLSKLSLVGPLGNCKEEIRKKTDFNVTAFQERGENRRPVTLWRAWLRC